MKAYLRGGPASGTYVHLDDETTTEISVPVLRRTCIHNGDIGNVLAIYRKEVRSNVPFIRMNGVEDFVTDFDAAAVGYWCQECEMDRRIKKEREEKTEEYLRNMRDELHRYVESLGYEDY